MSHRNNVIRAEFGRPRRQEMDNSNPRTPEGYTPEMFSMIMECGNTVRAKGIDTSQHSTQLAMIAVEASQALSWVTMPSGNNHVDSFIAELEDKAFKLECYRDTATDHYDHSEVMPEGNLYRNLADIVIRCFGYAAGNSNARKLYGAIHERLNEIADGPEREGHGF